MKPTKDAVDAVTLRWLVLLRWGAVLGQSALVLSTPPLFGVDLPSVALFTIIGIEAATNAACQVWAKRVAMVPLSLLTAVMALDVLLLTVILHLTGGSLNPFNFLYVVHIALAAVVLRPSQTWALAVLSLVCFATLFVELPIGVRWSHDDQMSLHLKGMWVAFAVAAAFIVYFVGRIRRALSEREKELERVRQREARSEKLASLATLAAGAAHELATPLGTIAIAAAEMEEAVARGEHHAVASDLQLIRAEVQRCRRILDRMSTDVGDAPGEALEAIVLGELAADAASELGGGVEVIVDDASARERVLVPRRAAEQTLHALLRNARDASRPEQPVSITTGATAHECWVEVGDRGSGMPPEVLARAAEPFFTTKEPGRGMGLGLFLAHALAERLGGRLDIDSQPGEGTRVRFVVPRRQRESMRQLTALPAAQSWPSQNAGGGPWS